MDDITTSPRTDFRLTPQAIDRVSFLLEQEEGDVFRVAVLGGGCSGFQYSFSIDDAPAEDDQVLNLADSGGKPVRVVVDEMSLEFLAGSELDYVQELIGSYFQVSNPNATASCGCGTSFAI
ncbi:HesB/IscA family protein [Alphaproteobacteria bacterium LSUCC0684]